MITNKHIELYQGYSLSHDKDSLYIRPHILLQPYISCYTITYPKIMPDNYTILPTASARFILSVTDNNIYSHLVGINTKAFYTGYVNKMNLLVLIEFYSGGLYPFIDIPQNEFLDVSFNLNNIDKALAYELETELIKSESIEALISAFDKLLINKLAAFEELKIITMIKNKIHMAKGNIHLKELSSEFYYSEKHIRRMFMKYIGTSPKMFSRIVRINHALNLLHENNTNFLETALQAGYFDQSHFIHDFKYICGSTPRQYIQNMSVFYNDIYKT